jgi:hypothetical protein
MAKNRMDVEDPAFPLAFPPGHHRQLHLTNPLEKLAESRSCGRSWTLCVTGFSI